MILTARSAARPYARHGSEAFNQQLHDVLLRLTRDVRDALGDGLHALVLGGGYGRGEGGVLQRGGREAPYNDLDLALILSRPAAARLDSICHRYESELGIHVDFSRPLLAAQVDYLPPHLVWYELALGHVVLHGPPDVLAVLADRMREITLHPAEATRLLLNRGAGLLWAMRVEAALEPPPHPDFVRRNYYKCALALGDATLIAQGRYQAAYAGRDALLAPFASRDELSLYREALSFKLRPDHVAPDQPDADRLAALARQFCRVYAETYTPLEASGEAPLNLLRNLRHGRLSLEHPRLALYEALPDLVTERPAGWARQSARFLSIWRRNSL